VRAFPTPSSIPFNRPFLIGRELEYIQQAVDGLHLSGGGPFTKRCQEWFQSRYGIPKVLLTHSCTAALEMAALLAGIEPGDEVLLPSFTFVSTANAFLLRGATLRFIDIREDTLNINESLLAEQINTHTRVICPVHYAGVGAEMETINALAKSHGLLVIEDAAQGVEARYQNRPLGSIGQLGAFSFHETKHFISGEGGALLINDEAYERRAEIIWEKGTNRAAFQSGEVTRYTWMDLGSSFLPSELVAAFLLAQLEHSDTIAQNRLSTWERYNKGLAFLQERGIARLPVLPPDCEHNAHMFYLILDSLETRSHLIKFLAERGILAVFHYVPLHTSPMGRSLGFQSGQLPVTEDLSARLLRLPMFYGLGQEEQSRVISAIKDFFGT
jgi:dTDP-4-amino-4,6-dideoxygalactose transaminase